jgi:ribosomal protein L25 (general stress protein Ctc)
MASSSAVASAHVWNGAEAQIKVVSLARDQWIKAWKGETDAMVVQADLREQEMQALVAVLESMTIKV